MQGTFSISSSSLGILPTQMACVQAFHNTPSPATMAAPRVALKRLSSIILSGSPRTVTLPVASRFSSSGSLRPATLQAASRSDEPFYDPFYAICGTSESQSFPPLHHEYMVQNLRDGFHICLYMIGVDKGDVKVWLENGELLTELIAEGIKEKDFEHEDGTKTLFRYRMLGPPNILYDQSAIKAEIKNGLLRVFVPRRNKDKFIPREC